MEACDCDWDGDSVVAGVCDGEAAAGAAVRAGLALGLKPKPFFLSMELILGDVQQTCWTRLRVVVCVFEYVSRPGNRCYHILQRVTGLRYGTGRMGEASAKYNCINSTRLAMNGKTDASNETRQRIGRSWMDYGWMDGGTD